MRGAHPMRPTYAAAGKFAVLTIFWIS